MTRATYFPRDDKIINCGQGSDSVINFNASRDEVPTMLVDPDTLVATKDFSPNHIMLAHELIHAERTMRGAQVKKEMTYEYKTDRKKFLGFLWWVYEKRTESEIPREEFATVGLMKKLDEKDITENMIREEQGLRLRGAYLCE